MRVRTAVIAAVMTAMGCSEEPARVFRPDASPADTGVRDAGAVVDNGVVTPADAGFPVDRPPVQTVRDNVRPDAPADSAMRFGGPDDPGAAPSIVYPETDTIIPPNLPSFEIHFQPGADNNLFEVAFAGSVQVARFYTRCTPVGGGCTLILDPAAIAQVSEAARGRGSVTVTVRGTRTTDGGEPTPVGTSGPVTLGITRDSLRGAVYWWAASGSIVRYDLGAADARAEIFLRGDLIKGYLAPFPRFDNEIEDRTKRCTE